jgi:hypothetical protein
VAVLGFFVGVPPVADLLGGGWPSVLGWSLAAAAVPAVLLVDAMDKGSRARQRTGSRGWRHAVEGGGSR